MHKRLLSRKGLAICACTWAAVLTVAWASAPALAAERVVLYEEFTNTG